MSLVPYVHPRRQVPRRSSGTRTHMIYPFPAPMKGLNTSASLAMGDPMTALRLENLIPRVFGCELRAGYSRWCSNMGDEIRTLMSYQPATGPAQFFAASNDGNIYDITAPLDALTTPPIVYTDLGALIDGEYSWTNFTTDAGVHYLVIVCAGVGIVLYDGTTWTPVVAGLATNPFEIESTEPAYTVDPLAFDFVMIWKRRLWFIENETCNAWYLTVGQVAGDITRFDFGSQLPHGGALAMLTNWTVDGGEGIDDKFVIIATQGDVLIYQGTDPDESTEFNMIGRWYLGRVPVGRRFATQYSQDIAIISERGMSFLSELLRGQGFFANAATAAAINSSIAEEVNQYLDDRYWEVTFLPREQLIVINRPLTPLGEYQWAFEVNNKAFCTLSRMPMHTLNVFEGLSYFGTSEGTVEYGFNGNSDGSIDEVIGADLQGIVVSAFAPMGEAVRLKRFLMIRPSFISRSEPSFLARLNPDWRFNVPGTTPPYVVAGDSLWDVGLWDTAIWSGETNSYQKWVGATDTGRYASLAMKVRGEAGTIFVSWAALVEPGGIL